MLDKNRLLGAIAAAGHSQRSLAEALKISKNTLNSKINGKTSFDTELIDQICNELRIVDYIERARIFLFNPSQNRDEQ
ncbi:helix-turn-helix domain-containing protein [Christensenellaceae bacterium OttesenSCG-928-L17]|nr:helix-turn-helix domain-containing protein [Christensenellaceae bacterium OttesenSCG-928-L17]